WSGYLLLGIILIAAFIALLKTPLVLRFTASVISLATLAILIGQAGTFLTPEGESYARISPAAGFWFLVFAFSLLLADGLSRLQLSPWTKVSALTIAAVSIGLLLVSGSWDSLSLLREYSNRADSFWAEG